MGAAAPSGAVGSGLLMTEVSRAPGSWAAAPPWVVMAAGPQPSGPTASRRCHDRRPRLAGLRSSWLCGPQVRARQGWGRRGEFTGVHPPPGLPGSTRNPWRVSAGATSSSPRWLMSGPRIFKQLPHAWAIRAALPLCPLRGGQVVHPESSGSCPQLKDRTFNSICEVPLPRDRARGRGHGAVCRPPALPRGQLGRHQQAGTRTLARSSALQPGTAAHYAGRMLTGLSG